MEMAATSEMVEIACKVRPHAVCIVPERRAERTTEGGLDAAGQRDALRPAVAKLAAVGIRVSLFIAAESEQIEAAVAIGAPVIEIHTGAWCDALSAGNADAAAAEFERIVRGAALAKNAGLEVHAGHGLDFVTAEKIAALSEIAELNIGHFLIGEAVFDGLPAVVRKMRAAMDRGRTSGRGPVMILGIGSDITDVRRIAKVLERHGDRFIDRVFTPTERRRPNSGETAPRPTPSASPPRKPAPRRWEPGFAPGCGGANGRGQPAGRPADLGTDRRRQTAAGGHHARRATKRASTSPSPTRDLWRRPS